MPTLEQKLVLKAEHKEMSEFKKESEIVNVSN